MFRRWRLTGPESKPSHYVAHVDESALRAAVIVMSRCSYVLADQRAKVNPKPVL